MSEFLDLRGEVVVNQVISFNLVDKSVVIHEYEREASDYSYEEKTPPKGFLGIYTHGITRTDANLFKDVHSIPQD